MNVLQFLKIQMNTDVFLIYWEMSFKQIIGFSEN